MTLDTLPAVRVDSLPERQEYAKALSVADLLPKQYRGNPGNVLYAIEFGRALGVEPIVAINQVHIIEGRTSASAGLISSLVRRAKHRLRVWVDRDDQGQLLRAVATIVRSDDPDFEFKSVWTMDRAVAAGVAGKAVWKNYPEAMLKARAITEVAREACEEALNGVGYTPEELGADQNPDGSWVVTDAPARTNQPGQTIRQAVASQVTATVTGDVEPAEPAVNGNEPRTLTDAQQKKMGALMRERGITDRDTALAFVSDTIGRVVASRKELTVDEASKVIEALNVVPPPVDEEPVDAEVVDDPDDTEAILALIVGEWENRGGTRQQLTSVFRKAMNVGHREATATELQAFLNQLKDGKHQPKPAEGSEA